MRILARPFGFLYKYLTAFVVLASPLFFIPGTSVSPEATYYLVVSAAIALAMVSYVASSLLTRAWHRVTRFEVLAYGLFTIALLLSAVFARDPKAILFGSGINPFSAASLLALPSVIYLVRSLPDDFRKKLKKALVWVLGVATFLFLFTFIFQGQVAVTTANVFNGFSSALSLALYIGIFVILIIAYLRRSQLKTHYKLSIGVTALIITSLLVSLSGSGDVRPNLKSSVLVARDTMIHNGVFGIGSGDFTRAWQLYRPQTVIDSPYFDVEFAQGSGTIPTFFTTLGLFGGLIFVIFMLGALYLTFIAYRKEQNEEDRHIALVLALVQAYFFIAAWVVPLSFAVLILWMAIVGFGLAKAELHELHPHRAMMFIAAPIAILLAVHGVLTWNKTRALLAFGRIQAATALTTDEIDSRLDMAIAYYPLDTLYRAKLENAINAARAIVSSQQSDQDTLKNKYLAQAQKAVDAGLAAVKLSPYNYQNYVSLGRAYELALPFDKDGAYDRAKKSYAEAIKLYQDNPYLYVMMARLEAAAGSKEGVRTQLTEALKKKQNFTDALYLMSQLSASEQNIDEALKYAVDAANNAPNDPNVLVQAGLLFYGKKDYANAVTALQRALQYDSTNNNIAYFLALSLRDGGRPDLAKQIGEELLRRNPGNADLTSFLKSLEPAAPATKSSK